MLKGKRKKGNNQKSIKLGLLITRGGGGVTLLYEANGDVSLDGVAFSRMGLL